MEPFLPSLLEWGPWLWRGITVAFVLLALGIVIAIRYARARATGMRTGRPIRNDRGAVRGVLRGAANPLAATVTVEAFNISPAKPSQGAADWRADTIWLETADKKIELRGPITVVSGSKFSSRRGGLPKLSKDIVAATHEQVPWSKHALYSGLVETLSDGDEIAVRGLPQPHAGKGETTAREADIAWTLEGTDEEPLRLVAIKPRAPRIPFGIGRSVLVMGAAWAIAAFAFHRAGKHYDKECSTIRWESESDRALRDRTVDAPLVLDNDHPCVIAASLDNDHPRALEMIRDLLERHPYRDAQVARALVELDRATRSCRERSELFYNRRFEEALEEARLCGDKRIEHESLVALGRYEEALNVPVPDADYARQLPTISTLVATKRWTEAADRVEHDAAELEQEHQPHQRCIAELLRYRGGDAGALDRLKSLAAAGEASFDPKAAPETSQSSCTGILALIDPATRKRWLAKRFDSGSRATAMFRQAAGGVEHWGYDPFESALLSPEASEVAWVWLPVEVTDDASRAFQLRQRTARALYDDDHAAAKRYATEAVAAAKVVSEAKRAARRKADAASGFDREWSYQPPPPDVLVEAVALYTDEIRTLEPIADKRQYSRLALRNAPPGEPWGFERNERELDEVKRTGSGRQLLGVLRPLGNYWYDADLLAVLPHIKTHRESIARELPYWPPQLGDELFGSLQRAMIRRELFERLGVPAEAAKWHQVYRRIAAVLEDPERLTALILVDR